MNSNWWTENSGFFGKFYMQGDNSIEGYNDSKKMTLSERTNEETQGIIKLCSLRKGDKVLDCPCGYGRHSISLANAGLKVIGVDLNSYELNTAIKEAAKQKVKVNFVKECMLKVNYSEKFDLVINMFYSFGFFDNDLDNFTVLKNFYNALKKGGRFLMHTDGNIPQIISGQNKEFEKRPLTNGGVLRQVEFYNKETNRNYGIWIIEKGGLVEAKEYSVRFYSIEEFEYLCKKAGFKEVKFYSDWTGKPYDTDSKDMICIAIK
ncbi:MAG: methyltransferase domain-containing protein [Candidatus Diapherotrites archaeon]|nr:methyltransferase domain-containing protein [Candidatus Diapherotrites archaeon]